jgi:hypothetical protein
MSVLLQYIYNITHRGKQRGLGGKKKPTMSVRDIGYVEIGRVYARRKVKMKKEHVGHGGHGKQAEADEASQRKSLRMRLQASGP